MDFVDLFCGMGTIRMGFEQAGHTCVYSVEWDKHKRRIYEVIFGREPEGSDITAVRANDIPAAACWCFGAPCQDFSIAGLRAGLDGERSSLVREVFRLIKEKEPANRPEWLLYENVKGMLSSNNGWDFAAIQAEMGELGYAVQWQLLNSKDFGVPQNRERVYTLGHLGRYGARKVFPLGKSCSIHNEPDADREAICETALCVTAKGQSNWTGSFVKQIGNVMPTATRDNPNQGRVYDPDGLAPCLNKMEGGGREPMIMEPLACLTPDRAEKRQNGRRFKELGEPMFTLTKQDIHGVLLTQKRITQETEISNTLTARNPSTSRGNFTPITGIVNDDRIRRLTPRECMRLQGVADCITDKLIAAGISDTQLYRAAGDACTVNVIYEIARRLS
jgi:DNA (cytosine-5)-methyltransferase 1